MKHHMQAAVPFLVPAVTQDLLGAALGLALSSRRGQSPDGPRYSTAMLGRFRRLGGTHCSHQQLTAAGSTRQTFSFRDPCGPGRRVRATS